MKAEELKALFEFLTRPIRWVASKFSDDVVWGAVVFAYVVFCFLSLFLVAMPLDLNDGRHNGEMAGWCWLVYAGWCVLPPIIATLNSTVLHLRATRRAKRQAAAEHKERFHAYTRQLEIELGLDES